MDSKNILQIPLCSAEKQEIYDSFPPVPLLFLELPYKVNGFHSLFCAYLFLFRLYFLFLYFLLSFVLYIKTLQFSKRFTKKCRRLFYFSATCILKLLLFCSFDKDIQPYVVYLNIYSFVRKDCSYTIYLSKYPSACSSASFSSVLRSISV